MNDKDETSNAAEGRMDAIVSAGITHSGHKYVKPITTGITECDGTVYVDVYSVLDAFNVTNPALQHAIKKLLMPGQRHAKSLIDDLDEAKDAITRAMQMEALKIKHSER